MSLPEIDEPDAVLDDALVRSLGACLCEPSVCRPCVAPQPSLPSAEWALPPAPPIHPAARGSIVRAVAAPLSGAPPAAVTRRGSEADERARAEWKRQQQRELS